MAAIVTFVSVMLLVSLSAIPLAAQTLQIGGDIAPNTAICLNNSTGATSIIEVQSGVGVVDCSMLPKSQGDALSIVVSGIAGSDVIGGECIDVLEVEPVDSNAFEAEEILPPNGCLLFQGTTSGALNPDGSVGPNTDVDGILVRATGIPAVRLNLQASAGHIIVPIDAQNNLLADCFQAPQTPTNCQFAVPGDFAIVVVSREVGPYTLEIAAQSSVSISQRGVSFQKDPLPFFRD